MKLNEAIKIIEERNKGYRVHFEHVQGKILVADYFPDSNEVPFKNTFEAWGYAIKFAEATVGKCVNIYVVDEKFSPTQTEGYEVIKNR